jgi:hypothetical protein
MKLNREQQEQLLDSEILHLDVTKLILESVEIQYMDSHGYNVKVAVARLLINNRLAKLVGFKFKSNADQSEFDDEVELVDVVEVEVKRHYRLDGKRWRDDS